jgi:hypothetical protein
LFIFPLSDLLLIIVLSYCSPFSLNHKSSLEAVQNKFLSFLCYRYNISLFLCFYFGYFLSWDSLELRRIKIYLYFLFNVVNNNINCLELFCRLSFMVQQRFTRSHVTLYVSIVSNQRTNYAMNSLINRILQPTNKYNIYLFYFHTLYSFKQNINYYILGSN